MFSCTAYYGKDVPVEWDPDVVSECVAKSCWEASCSDEIMNVHCASYGDLDGSGGSAADCHVDASSSEASISVAR